MGHIRKGGIYGRMKGGEDEGGTEVGGGRWVYKVYSEIEGL